MIYKLGKIVFQRPMIVTDHRPRSSVLHKYDFGLYEIGCLKVFLKTDGKNTERTIKKDG